MGHVYIVGASEQGQIVAEILQLSGHTIGGFFDDAGTERYLGFPVLGRTTELAEVVPRDGSFIVAIGNCQVRARIYERYRGQIALTSAIHPSAIIMPSATLGEGVTIHPGARIATAARIGDGVIVNTGAIVEHHNVIGNYAHVCPGAVLGGGVTIGDTTWVGLGSVVRDHIAIGSYAFVGQGANVTRPVADGVLVYGNPARVQGPSPYRLATATS